MKIAVIDDNIAYAKATAVYLKDSLEVLELFSDESIQIFVFESCVKFCAYFSEPDSELSIVICDYKLDKDQKNGIECANEITITHHSTKIILLTGEGGVDIAHASSLCNLTYVPKGIGAADVLLETLLGILIGTNSV